MAYNNAKSTQEVKRDSLDEILDEILRTLKVEIEIGLQYVDSFLKGEVKKIESENKDQEKENNYQESEIGEVKIVAEIVQQMK